jgi:hypothetical protein
LPQDGVDNRTAASLYQALKVNADFIAFIQSVIAMQRPSTSVDTPQSVWKDAAGNNRHTIDHNGYSTGRISQFREYWVPINANNPTWVFSGASGGSVTRNVIAAYPSPFQMVNTSTTAGGNATVAINGGQQCVHLGSNDIAFVMECEIGVASSVLSSLNIYLGLASVANAAASSHIWLKKGPADTNWQVDTRNVGAGTQYSVDTGVAVSGSVSTYPVTRLRMEIFGANTPHGRKVRVFINETIVTESLFTTVNANLPTTNAVGPWISIDNSSTTNDNTLYVGPITMTWNRQLSLPAL